MLFLTGMPGSGKSYWGRALAACSGWSWADTDVLIAEYSGEKVSDFIKKQGLERFRSMETRILSELPGLFPTNTIVSTGGGTVLRSENRARMRQLGCIVWLDMPIQLLLSRLSGDNSRPLLEGGDLVQNLEEMYAIRKQTYQDADFIFSNADLQLYQLLPVLQSCIKQPL